MSISNPSKPYTFTDGTTGYAAEVNSDFDVIYAKAVEIVSAVNNINADNITSGTLALARIPTTLTGKDADTVDTFHASQTPGNSAIPVLSSVGDLKLGSQRKINISDSSSVDVFGGDRNDAWLRGISGVGGIVNCYYDGAWKFATASGYALREDLYDNSGVIAKRVAISTTSSTGIGGAITWTYYSLWHSGNDGAGSILDADKLDGEHGSYYLPAGSYTAADVLSKLLTVDGASSGLDADLLDGQSGSYYTPLYTLSFHSNFGVVGDSTTFFAGDPPVGGSDITMQAGTRIPQTGHIIKAYITASATAGTAGSAENISAYVRLNNSTDTLIATTGVSALVRTFNNTGLNIAVTAGDYVHIKFVFPAWATNPSDMQIGGNLLIGP